MIWRFLSRFVASVALMLFFGLALFVVLLPGPADGEVTDAIVVTTGGPGRVARGIALVRAGKAKRLLISGADRTVRPYELAATYHVPGALFDCCIDLGREAVDTRSNADETADWVLRHHYRSLRLVTSAWHMPRARLELDARLGGKVKILSDAVEGEREPGAMLAEYIKYLLRLGAIALGMR